MSSLNKNKLHIQGIHLSTTIGVHDWEQKYPQSIIMNLSLEIPYSPAAFQQDQLEGTFNYTTVVADLKAWVAPHRCQLLEYLAEKVAEHLFEKYPTPWVKVEITKPRVTLGVDATTIEIERYRNPQ